MFLFGSELYSDKDAEKLIAHMEGKT